jgi:peptidoglycan/LPS O-acetylase OafA/YrhL
VLDAWRGIAILLVLAVHCDYALAGGWLGVHLFFVLSGFLITTLLLAERRSAGRIDLVGFYRRRALRLVPALFAMLATYVAAMAIADVVRGDIDLGYSVVGAAYGAGYLVNVVMFFAGPEAVPLELNHLWSLGMEEQFYLVWPIVLVAFAFVRVLRAWVIALALAAVVVGTGAAYDLTSIVVGCVAGVLFSFGVVRRIPMWLAAASLVPMVVLVVSIDHAYHATPPILLFTIPTAVVLLACVLAQDSRLSRAFDLQVLRWFGTISYGLYVWHWPIFVALGWQLGLPTAVVVAALSYRYVEQPFLRRKYRPDVERRSDGRPAASVEPVAAVS